MTRSHFKSFLAHPKIFINAFGRRFIVEWQIPVVFFQQAHYLFGFIFYFRKTGLSQYHIDFFIGADFFYEAGKMIALLYLRKYFTAVQDAGKLVIDNHHPP